MQKEILSKIQKFFKKKKGINLVYLYGSKAKNKQKLGSDIDLGVLLNSSVSEEEYSQIRLNLTTQLMNLLNFDKIDLVILNQSPPLLCYQAVLKGKILYIQNKEKRTDFELKVLREYEDTKFLRKIQSHYLKEKTRLGFFGRKITKDFLIKVQDVIPTYH